MSNRPRILLVEDHESERRLLYHALKNDFDVLEACSATTAWETICRSTVDVVVLDMHLPPDTETPLQGLRLCKKLHEHDGELPILVTTSDTRPELAAETLELGALCFFTKPVDPVVLRRSVVEVIGRRRGQSGRKDQGAVRRQ